MKKSFVFSLITFFPLPIIFLVGVFNFHLFISILYTLTAAVIAIEIVAGSFVRKEYGCITKPTTAIIPAYLPNEKEIIFDTLQHFLEKTNFSNVLLVYNSPKEFPEVEQKLAEWSQTNEKLTILKVPNSKSKAENLNAALDSGLITTEYLAIFDADHKPNQSSLQYAITWLNEGYDAVQGRCIISNRVNWLTKMIAAEFDTVYRLLHNSRFNISGTGIFGGSNCYWKTASLNKYRFNDVLTEDIDLSLRALSQGTKIAHDPNLISCEEAPETIRALWKQRVRWSSGWLEVTLKHSKKMMFSSHLNLFAKIYWFYNLIYREIFSFLSLSIVFILSSYFIFSIEATSRFFPITTFFTVGCIFFVTAMSKLTCDRGKYKFLAIINLATVYPFTMVKSLITTMAWTRYLVGDKSWMPTQRRVK